MGRGTWQGRATETPLRRGLRLVDQHFAGRLAALPHEDSYRLGDLAHQLLARLGVNVGPETSHELIRKYLPERAAAVNSGGLRKAMQGDGLIDVGHFRSAMVAALGKIGNQLEAGESEILWERELAAWRGLAQRTREQEFNWLASHLRLSVDGYGLDRRQRERLLLALWHEGLGAYEVEDRARELIHGQGDELDELDVGEG